MDKCPYKYKYEFVNWLCDWDKNITKSQANNKSIAQLKWLFYNAPKLKRKRKENKV